MKGLGKARLETLNKAGITTLSDLLLTLPVRYQDTSVLTPLGEIAPGMEVCVSGFPKAAPRLSRFHGLTSVTLRLCDETGGVPVVWYNQPWLQTAIHPEDLLTLYGRIDRDKQGRIRMASPVIVKERGILPVYKALAGLPPKTMRELIRQALTQLEDCCPETLPEIIRVKYQLCERNFALRQAHFPETRENLAIALRRLSFEGMLLYQAAAASLRGERTKGIVIDVPDTACEAYWASLPFPPTNAQKRVLSEIAGDLKRPQAMGRMVQGDVGCGKTALAFGAIALTAQAGFQSALMAPTEILARQHLESAKAILEPLGIPCGLLVGGMKAKERREALEKIASGEWMAVIGTHALISEGVEYKNLGLVVTDEQHRFGVRQRRLLSKKAESTEEAPNELVLSATPIPRTLALVLYGDLDLSIVDELPPGRTPVKTRIVPEEKRDGLYSFIKQEAAQGRQTYIVCPLVEESEMIDARSAQETYAELCNGPLSDLRVGLTYGEQDAGGTAWMVLMPKPKGVAQIPTGNSALAAPVAKKCGLDTKLGVEPMGELTHGALGTVPMIIAFWPLIFGGAYGMTKRREAMAEAAKAQAVVDEKKKVMDAALQCIEKEQGKEAADKARAAMEAAMAKEEASKTEGEDK